MVTSLVQKCTFPTETQRLIVRRRRHPVGGRNGWVQTSFRRNITAESQPIIYVDELKENIRRICMKQPIGQNTINRALNSGACHILQNSCISVFFFICYTIMVNKDVLRRTSEVIGEDQAVLSYMSIQGG